MLNIGKMSGTIDMNVMPCEGVLVSTGQGDRKNQNKTNEEKLR